MNLLIFVNTTKPFNQYGSYVAAFLAKRMGIKDVTVFYGAEGVTMSKKGALAELAIEESVKELIAAQLEGVSASDLPDNLELFARYVKDKLGVDIYSCGTFHVIGGFATSIEDTTNIEDFITPVKLPDAAKIILDADKILYY